MSSSLVVLITGCSTGLGRCLAEEALARGLRVIATARRLSAIEDLREKGAHVLSLDVDASPTTLKEFRKEAINAFGQVDCLINNAGWLLAGAIEENTPEEVRSQFDTNFFGVINVTNVFLPHFRARKTGTIVNISSKGAYLAVSGAGIYCAAKAALDCLTETWADELAPFNIRAMSVNLGAFRTSVASSKSKPPTNAIEGYDAAHDWHKQWLERSGNELGDPDKGAKKLLDMPSPKVHLPREPCECNGSPLEPQQAMTRHNKVSKIASQGTASHDKVSHYTRIGWQGECTFGDVILKLNKPLPVRFALGEDAVYLVKKRLNQRIAEVEEWTSYGMDTNVTGQEYKHANW